jgi:hypothetical protein
LNVVATRPSDAGPLPDRLAHVVARSEAAVSAVYLDFALLTMVLAAFQGWLGGEVVFSDGVFVRHTRAASTAEAGHGKGGHGHHH